MNFGPFSSYAPTYDSSFANISKEESDLIYSSYGEDNSQTESERCVNQPYNEIYPLIVLDD